MVTKEKHERDKKPERQEKHNSDENVVSNSRNERPIVCRDKDVDCDASTVKSE